MKEREGIEVFKTDEGFATYVVRPRAPEIRRSILILDIFVPKEKRRAGAATRIADALCKEFPDLLEVYGQVDLKAANADQSIRVLHGYGMRFVQLQGASLMVFLKDLDK